jgi:hypothetical protein
VSQGSEKLSGKTSGKIELKALIVKYTIPESLVKNRATSFFPLFLTQIPTRNRIAAGGKPTAKDRRRENGCAVNRAIQGKTPPRESLEITLGARGRRFKSCHPDQKPVKNRLKRRFFCYIGF